MKKTIINLGYICAYLVDLLYALLISIYTIFILGPLNVFFRTPLFFGKFFKTLYILVPMKLVSPLIKMFIDWRLGHFDIAIVQGEEIISQLEKNYLKQKGQ